MSERAATYEVQGGQGHRVLGRGLSKRDAEALAQRFDEGCAKYGLNNPPALVVQDGWT